MAPRRLQKAVHDLFRQLASLGLRISPEKSTAIASIRKKIMRYPIILAEHTLSYMKAHRFLVVFLDRGVKFTPEIDSD